MRGVLIVVTRQIGDVLLTTPLIAATRERWPRARIDVLGIAGTLGMLKGNPHVDGAIDCPARMGWRDGLALLRRIWRRYDLALVADPGDRAHLIGWAAARQRSGIVPEQGTSNALKRLTLQHAVTSAGDRGDVHIVLEKLQLLAPWGDGVSIQPTVQAPAPAALPQAIASMLARRYIVVHAPSMWHYKQWPIAHYAALVQALLARGEQVVLTGSASERDQGCIAPLRALAAPPEIIDTSGQFDFNQLATLISGAALYIGPDTSVTHLAAATGTPVIAIFGPTNPQRWGPWPSVRVDGIRYQRASLLQRLGNVTMLQSDLPCVPCGRAGCDDHRDSRSDCLSGIAPERVSALAAQLLQAPRGA